MDSPVFLMVEGVNIGETVFDTDQLSVVRGGSFLLKVAIERIRDASDDKLKPLSTGASRGFFLAHEPNPDPLGLCQQVCEKLGESPDFAFLCFLVDWCRAKTVREAKERLLAKIRYRQLQAITRVPDRPVPNGSPGPDQLEGVRSLSEKPEKRWVQRKKRLLSESVLRRLDKGRLNRKDYYAEDIKKHPPEGDVAHWLDKLKEYGFAQEFETLVRAGRFPRLANKMAVVYFDGNGFSGIERVVLAEAGVRLEQQVKAQQEFDGDLKSKRANFLYSLLGKILASSSESKLFPAAWVSLPGDERDPSEPEKVLRLETLLWGGDEVLFVVPAWLGMDLVQYFYEVSAGWRTKKEPHKRLTHAGGIVFCHVKTPIRIIRETARALAERAKDHPRGREVNSFDYMVLESIDYPAEPGLDEFFGMRYGEMAESRQPLRPVLGWEGIKETMRTRLHGQNAAKRLPKRQIFQIAETLTRQSLNESFGGRHRKGMGWDALAGDKITSGDLSPLETMERRMLDVAENSELHEHMKQIFQLFDADPKDQRVRGWAYLHLVELWDYLAPELRSEPQTVEDAGE